MKTQKNTLLIGIVMSLLFAGCGIMGSDSPTPVDTYQVTTMNEGSEIDSTVTKKISYTIESGDTETVTTDEPVFRVSLNSAVENAELSVDVIDEAVKKDTVRLALIISGDRHEVDRLVDFQKDDQPLTLTN